MFDTIEKIDNSLIQHGPMNQRVYLMKLNGQDLPDVMFKIDVLAQRQGYTKIFAKVPLQAKQLFTESGYEEEARVAGFYDGEVDAVFLAKYLASQRRSDTEQQVVDEILELARHKGNAQSQPLLQNGLTIRPAGADDAEAMVRIFKQVFESYPFPIHDPAYLRETMQTHVQYFCVFEGNSMIAVSSAEMDESANNVEMTDFATLPDYRGRGLAQQLLTHMETHMSRRGLKTAYTIARALSAGMNITFARGGYQYGGTLVNNTNICGKIESMNVWYKSLAD